MRKNEELTNPNSCMNKARDDEMTFVLIGRDAAAPVAIRAWVSERLRIGKNQPDDQQITEALECADTMERERSNATPFDGTYPNPLREVRAKEWCEGRPSTKTTTE